MTAPNLPNGAFRPGLSFELCRADYSIPVPVISQAPSLVSAPRNAFNTYHSNTHSRGANLVVKSTVSGSSSNFSLVTTSNISQSNVNNFANYPAFSSIFQTLLRGSNTSQVPIAPANVSGYVNAVAGPNGNLFTGFRPAQLSYQSNINISAPACIPTGPTHVTVSSVTLNSVNCSSRNNISAAPKVAITHSYTPTNSRRSVASSVESLFVSTNLMAVSDSTTNGMRKLGAMAFLRWAAVCTRCFRKERLSVWPRCKADTDALHEMNWVIAPPGLLGIYSESPFLRPVVLLRRVQFAAPGNVNPNVLDTDNMVRSLREMADSRITKYPGFAPHFPPSAASVGFTTDYMTYIFTLELERQVIKLLHRPKIGGHSEWRVVLRLGWATTDFYVPDHSSGVTSHRALALESLPRCLSVRVAGRSVPLPDPIFHGGQAQRLGKRLRLSIDITDKVLLKCNSTARNRVVDIELTWLHVPLEDQSAELLNIVADGLISPLLCHLVGLPLVQVTLDRAYTVSDLRNTFNLDNSEPYKTFVNGPLLDPVEFPPLTTNSDDSGPLEYHGVFGVYDKCLPPCRSLPVANTKDELKSRFKKTCNDNDLSICDGDVEVADYIPICLLCPLTRTRIDIPVRSFKCSHLQCFDLHSYLSINMRRPRWTCPICSIPAPFRDLRVDELFISILKNPRSADAEFVQLDANGSWHLNNICDSGEAETDKLFVEPKHTDADTNLTFEKGCKAEGEASLDMLKESENGANMHTVQVDKKEQSTTNTFVNRGSETGDGNSHLEPEVIILSDDEDEEKDERDDDGGCDGHSLEKDEDETMKVGDKSMVCDKHKRNVGLASSCSNEMGTTTKTASTLPSRPMTLEIDLTNEDSDSSHCGESNGIILESSSNGNHIVLQNEKVIHSDLSSDFVRTRDAIRLGNRDPLIVISPLPSISITNALSGSIIDDKLNSHLINEFTSMRNELTLYPKRLSDVDSDWPLEFAQNMTKSTKTSNNINNNKYNTNHNKSAIYQRFLELTAHTVNQTIIKQNSHNLSTENDRLTNNSLSYAYNSGSKRKGYLTKLNNKKTDNRSQPSKKVIVSDSEDESLDTPGSVPSTSSTSRRNPQLMKMQQAAALARLMQERSRRIRSISEASNELNEKAVGNLPSTSSAISRTTSRQTAVNANSKKRRTTRKRQRQQRSNVSDDSETSSQSFYTSEMSCVSASEPSSESVFSNSSSRCTEEDDDDVSVDSFSSNDRWSPSQDVCFGRKKQPKRKPARVRR
ncbi:unnamed protein product [Heterobilharzia americana]|nr:unnamed protein product [Heterobilharzia americana]